MPASDYREGVDGAGSAWKEEVDTDEAENNYQNGADGEAAENYQSNASAAGDRYAEGLADYLGVNEDDITTAGSYSSGVNDAGEAWQQGVSRSGGKWRRGVSRASAQEYEQAAQEAADEWMENFQSGVTE